VRLLLDQNLSPALVDALRDVYPDCLHVRSAGLSQALDETVWTYAAGEGFTIVTKDGDFSGRAFLFGPPPKVVWIQLGNCSTRAVETLLRDRRKDLLAFHEDHEAGLLVLP